MAKKLGLQSQDPTLVTSLFSAMEKTGCDFTNTFRILAGVQKAGENKRVVE